VSDADCRKTEGCALHGRCTMARDGCVAKDDYHETRACKQRGECTAAGEKCVATTNQDCAASEVCKRFGWCSLETVSSLFDTESKCFVALPTKT
jgi:hypothetical protein